MGGEGGVAGPVCVCVYVEILLTILGAKWLYHVIPTGVRPQVGDTGSLRSIGEGLSFLGLITSSSP